MIISLYAGGMTIRDIQHHLATTIGTDLSHETISKITDAVHEEVVQWQKRPLEELYPIVYLDALVIKIRDGHQVKNRAAHIAVGARLAGPTVHRHGPACRIAELPQPVTASVGAAVVPCFGHHTTVGPIDAGPASVIHLMKMADIFSRPRRRDTDPHIYRQPDTGWSRPFMSALELNSVFPQRFSASASASAAGGAVDRTVCDQVTHPPCRSP
jgi:Transposase, Mutator family